MPINSFIANVYCLPVQCIPRRLNKSYIHYSLFFILIKLLSEKYMTYS